MKITTCKRTWDNYAASHLSCLSSTQIALYQFLAEQAKGRVIDCGCGSGRLAAFMENNPDVQEIVGIDSAVEMIEAANWLVDTLNLQHSRFQMSRIEEMTLVGFDCAISVNSFYAWTDVPKTLYHIRKSLKTGGRFVLATPNHRLNMNELIQSADKELIGNPLYSTFRETNRQLASQYQDKFLPMSQLIAILTAAEFHIESCDQRYFNGGMNTVVMTV